MVKLNHISGLISGKDRSKKHEDCTIRGKLQRNRTTNSLKELPDWVFNPARYGISVPVKRVASDAEKSATLSYFIAQNERKDVSNHDAILDYTGNNRIPFYPPFIKHVVGQVNKNLKPKDYVYTRKGNYIAPVRTEDVINVMKDINEKNAWSTNWKNSALLLIDGLDDEIYIERKKAKYAN